MSRSTNPNPPPSHGLYGSANVDACHICGDPGASVEGMGGLRLCTSCHEAQEYKKNNPKLVTKLQPIHDRGIKEMTTDVATLLREKHVGALVLETSTGISVVCGSEVQFDRANEICGWRPGIKVRFLDKLPARIDGTLIRVHEYKR